MKNLLSGVLLLLAVSGVYADSPQLQKLKQMLSTIDNPPPSMVKMVKDLEKMEKRSNGGKEVKSKSLSEYSCRDKIAGLYKASDGNQILRINSDGSGHFLQYSYDAKYKDYHEYKSEVDFDWSTTKNTITFNYISNLNITEIKTGKVVSKPIKSGTVSCQFGGSFIDVGGVTYYK